MKRKNLWISLSLLNLCVVALFGMTLRTKFLFSIPFIDYKNFLSAHSHFAFGGWVTLALMVLYIDSLLSPAQKQKNIYQWLLWGIQITSLGMVATFPFTGYALLSIIFSTAFIFFTYGFSWVFIKDLKIAEKERSIKLLCIGALISLVISSIGPFTLAYILATETGNAFLYRDSIYTYLHFQYNGFFTLSVFALLFNQLMPFMREDVKKKTKAFSLFLCLSVVPALFLSLLWHGYNVYIRAIAFLGCVLIIATLIAFFRVTQGKKIDLSHISPLGRALLAFSMLSFLIKMFLQMGTVIPALGNAVFGYRPIIIGFLHLVFLGFVSFYILFNFFETGVFLHGKLSVAAIVCFAAAVILNETILLIEGIGLMLHTTHRVYPWLLWIASIMLFVSAIWIFIARLKSQRLIAGSYEQKF